MPRKWPNGRLSADDDGELQIKVGSDNEKEVVALEFAEDAKWVAMTPQQAIGLAELLIKHARRVTKKPITMNIPNPGE